MMKKLFAEAERAFFDNMDVSEVTKDNYRHTGL